jgi:hypothetical protein
MPGGGLQQSPSLKNEWIYTPTVPYVFVSWTGEYVSFTQAVKCKGVPVYVVEAYGDGGIAPLILKVSSTGGECLHSSLRCLIPRISR